MRKTALLVVSLFALFAVNGYSFTFPVVNNADSGAGSLRYAIEQANFFLGEDTITFAIGSGPQTIALVSALPIITEALTIAATTQAGWTSKPLIELDASLVSSPAGQTLTLPDASRTGLRIHATGAVKARVINSFQGNGTAIADDAFGHVGNFSGMLGCWI